MLKYQGRGDPDSAEGRIADGNRDGIKTSLMPPRDFIFEYLKGGT